MAETTQPVTHHISDVDTWIHPDRNYFTFVVISVLLGFLGMDHFYLRSYGTGTYKFLINTITFGMWYWWDLVQIFADGAKIRKEGLASPLEWIRGIGRGVFQEPGEKYYSKKSYVMYTFLALFFGWLGADKFYLGQFWQGLAKVLSCFNIFLFLFGWLWVMWDSVHALCMTETVLAEGVHAPLPYNLLFSEVVKGDVFKVTEKGEYKSGFTGFSFPLTLRGWLDLIAKWVYLPPVPTLPLREAYKDLVVPLVTPPLVKAIKNLDAPHPVPQIQPMTPVSMTPPIPNMKETLDSTSHVVGESAKIIQKGFEEGYAQKGGGRGDGPGPVIAGVLTAVVLAGGLKGFYDIVSKQLG